MSVRCSNNVTTGKSGDTSGKEKKRASKGLLRQLISIPGMLEEGAKAPTGPGKQMISGQSSPSKL